MAARNAVGLQLLVVRAAADQGLVVARDPLLQPALAVGHAPEHELGEPGVGEGHVEVFPGDRGDLGVAHRDVGRQALVRHVELGDQ
jgi:hypothetical protein